MATIGSVVGDEGFHNVLSAICSTALWILSAWCLNKIVCSAECHDLFHNVVNLASLMRCDTIGSVAGG